ncbi:MAG: ParB/Srx family N-terminal domain-containing protein [Candidatus Zixiibacteriota bacterium]
MKLERVRLERLKLHPANPRLHNEKNLAAIKDSLTRYGQQKPVVIDTKNVVIAGNGTVTAARELGWTTVDVVRTELKGTQAKAFAIADNRTGELSTWDDGLLLQQIESISRSLDITALDLGFSDDDLKALSDQIEASGISDLAAPVPGENAYREQYGVIVMCDGEQEQSAVYAKLTKQGYQCKVVTT